MILSIRLGGHEGPWWFRGSGRARRLLDQRRWVDSADLWVIRLSSLEVADQVTVQLRRELLAATDGAADVHVQRIAAVSDGEGLAQTIARFEGFDVTLPAHDLRELIVSMQRPGPRVYIVDVTPALAASPALSEGMYLTELTGKQSPGRGLSLIFLDCHETPLADANDVVDLSTGAPIEGVMDMAARGGDSANLWRAYLHARLAWETGGHIARAVRWAEAGIGGLPVGADSELEGLFNRLASEEFERLPRQVRRAVDTHLARAVRGDNGREDRDALLMERGLLWLPPSERGPRLVGWAARALLPRADGVDRTYLRACLLCSPLLRDLLSRCLILEARRRASHLPSIDERLLGDEPSKALAKFADGSRAHYPSGHLAVPDCPVDFATLGQVLGARKVRTRAQTDDRLLELRNHLAHGHYASWHTVRELVRVEEMLGP